MTWTGPGSWRAGRGGGPGDHRPGRAGAGAGPAGGGGRASAGDLDRAEAAARAITDPGRQAQALADLATTIGQDQARSLLAQALVTGGWEPLVGVLVQIDPSTVIAIADEYLAATL